MTQALTGNPDKFHQAPSVDVDLIKVLKETGRQVRLALETLENWGPSGLKPGQYRCDLVADSAALDVLLEAGIHVFSEESGFTHTPTDRPGPFCDQQLTCVLDPVDGSTNASRNIPWWATSMCLIDHLGPRVAVVVNQASGKTYEAIRGHGAWVGNTRLTPSGKTDLGRSIVGLSGYPARHLGWNQYRALGAAALDLACVAEGVLDGYLDSTAGSLAPWDYLGGYLLCVEAGAQVIERDHRDLFELTPETRRAPIAAATPELADQILRACST